MRTRIKFCGMTNVEDALAAANLGIDAIGLIFYESSPRNVSLSNAVEICAKLPAFVTKVGVFVNPNQAFINNIINKLPIDLLQFHGDESPEFCRSFELPFIKVIHMKEDVSIEKYYKKYKLSRGFLVDTFKSAKYGGTGETFAWETLPNGIKQKLILAGGLNAGNVGRAIQQVHPFAVDVVSGIEASKGRKDLVKMQAFVTAVKEADQEA